MLICPPVVSDTYDVNLFSQRRPQTVETYVVTNKSSSVASNNGIFIKHSFNKDLLKGSNQHFITELKYKSYLNDFPMPKADVLSASASVNDLLKSANIETIKINALEEGGVEFDFSYQDSYFNIKLDNEGDGLLYIEKYDSVPEGWDLSLNNLILKVKEKIV